VFTIDELQQIVNILAQRPYGEVANLIARVFQEAQTLPPQTVESGSTLDLNAGNVAA
jgi:hypothetical protein